MSMFTASIAVRQGRDLRAMYDSTYPVKRVSCLLGELRPGKWHSHSLKICTWSSQASYSSK